MKNYKIKTGLDFIILILMFVENFLLYDAIHNFQSGSSNPAHSNRFRSHTGGKVKQL